MKKGILPFLVFISFLSSSQSNNLQYFYSQAKEAYQAGDHPKFYEMIMQAHNLHPYHQGILYQAGLAAALTNKPDESIQYLNQAIQINAEFDLSVNDLKSLESRADFLKLKDLQKELLKPIIHSDTALVIKDRTLHLESITAGESSGIFYLGSIHKRKIIKVDRQGNTTNFTSSAQDGLTSVFGVKIDLRKKVLWVCSSPMPEMENYDSTARSAVYKYDIKTGKLIAKFYPDHPAKEFVFGDLALNNKGEVFVSDSKNNIIFRANEANGKLEPFFTSEEFWNIQGLTFSPYGKYLFIADYIKGIFRLDVQEKRLTSVTPDFDLSTKSIDGLTYYNNSLIAIQNYITPMRVTRYFLNDVNDKLTHYEIIDRAHPAFNEPTIGCLSGQQFYYIANSQWSGYDEQHSLKPLDQLQVVVILYSDLGE